ncbi:MAG: 23S rRNA (adenine(2503)-C(2))-methyltransferase RlmN [Bacteroidaceae bacterium]|nr:23S rRNA (adenine(2503)-C(2))-methyltransferase RlmN [Bacteroidaceae bacterium]
MDKQLLLGMSLQQLQDVTAELGMPRFTAKQIMQWLYQKNITEIDDMTNLSKTHRQRLTDCCIIGRSMPIETQTSEDGTEKYLFKTVDGHYVETVYIPDHERATLCVSSQVGCKMNCEFCQTGKQGFNGNLTPADILNQIYTVNTLHIADGGLTNIVFMGQGEPLDNYDAVKQTIDILTAAYGWAWSPKRITVSTIGLKKNLSRFLNETECQLAVSLHFPLHEQRLQYMPAERQFAIEGIIELLKQYDWSHQRRLSFEYTMFDGVNDTTVFAKELVRLLKNLPCRVNLIPFHQIEQTTLTPTPMDKITSFRDYLTRHGVYTTIRTSRGQDIQAACGLLTTKALQDESNK